MTEETCWELNAMPKLCHQQENGGKLRSAFFVCTYTQPNVLQAKTRGTTYVTLIELGLDPYNVLCFHL